jgi:hypothetical protein
MLVVDERAVADRRELAERGREASATTRSTRRSVRRR